MYQLVAFLQLFFEELFIFERVHRRRPDRLPRIRRAENIPGRHVHTVVEHFPVDDHAQRRNADLILPDQFRRQIAGAVRCHSDLHSISCSHQS